MSAKSSAVEQRIFQSVALEPAAPDGHAAFQFFASFNASAS